MNNWDLNDAYSITFFVYSNECYEYNDITNITQFNISYNTETHFEKNYNPLEDSYYRVMPDKQHTMQRWSYAYLCGDEEKVLNEETYQVLFDWYKQEGIKNIGYEDEQMMDACVGPIGYQEVLDIITKVAFRIQKEDYFLIKWGKRIPIIIQDYEFMDCVIEATRKANIHGEANIFLESV